MKKCPSFVGKHEISLALRGQVRCMENMLETCCNPPPINTQRSKFALTVFLKPGKFTFKAMLVGGWTTHLKNMIVKLGSSSPNRRENKKYLKPPPRLVLFYGFPTTANNGTPKSSILIGFSIINHPFLGTPIFGNIQINHPAALARCADRNLWVAPNRSLPLMVEIRLTTWDV